MKTVYVVGTVVLAGILIFTMRSLPKRIDASVDAKTDQVNSREDQNAASLYAFPYPVSDQVRCLVRFAREQVSLALPQFQSLENSAETAQELLSSIRSWVQPRQSQLGQTREKFLSARDGYLARQGRMFMLEERLKSTIKRPAPDAELTAALKVEPSREREALPMVQENFERIDNQINHVLFPVFGVPIFHNVERMRWDASQGDELTKPAWFVPDLSDAQKEDLRQGRATDDLSPDSQKEIRVASLERYQGATFVASARGVGKADLGRGRCDANIE